jgi:hypothetical protein
MILHYIIVHSLAYVFAVIKQRKRRIILKFFFRKNTEDAEEIKTDNFKSGKSKNTEIYSV